VVDTSRGIKEPFHSKDQQIASAWLPRRRSRGKSEKKKGLPEEGHRMEKALDVLR